MLGRRTLAAMLLAQASLVWGAERAIVDAAKFVDRSLGDCGIQRAIDSLPKEGGIVELPEGRFPLERYLFLKSGTTLRGKGRKTILAAGKPETRRNVAKDAPANSTEIAVEGDLAGLRPGMLATAWRFRDPGWVGHIKHYRVKEIRGQTVVFAEPVKCEMLLRNKAQLSWGFTTALAAPTKKGDKAIQVEHPEFLPPGTGITFAGDGDLWNHHFNAIVAAQGNTLTLERAVGVNAQQGTHVHHAYSAITADGQENIAIEGLDIEGWPGEERPVKRDFYFSAVQLVRTSNILVRDLHVRDWQADGVSIQAGKNCLVDHCVATGNSGHGFHSGTDFTDGLWQNLKATANGADGFYYCWHDKNVVVRNCVLSENRGHGVGGLGNPGDRRCTVEGNTIERNGKAGIEVNGGMASGSVIRNNIVRDNSRSKPGQWPGIALFASAEDARGYTVEANVVESTLPEPTQWVGIEERCGDPPRREVERDGKKVVESRIADENVIRGNKLSGHKAADILLVGPRTVCEDNPCARVKPAPALPK
ncbi:MAG: hypothetical protein FJ291_08695 [Planctomycetes bacterium]|nr:hypothetical protein [Planctomycetota bacterium]